MSDADPAVLIVNWSTPDDLDRCLETLRIHEGDIETFVFQNFHSSDNTRKGINVAKYHRAYVWNHLENLGHGAGINRLAAKAKYEHDYLFVVNPDVMWTEPVVDRLVTFLQEDPERCMVGPKQLNSQGKITAGGIFGTLEKPEHRLFKADDPANQKARDILQATVVAGSALMISTDDFFEYGGLLEAHHYYSETWLCYHAAVHGRTNWYYGEASMIHEWHTSSPMGFEGTDGKFKADQALFRKMCDEHEPPIPHD